MVDSTLKSALILSPFATTPLDAGHRRRVFQTTSLLRRQGYRIIFLFYAFENAWGWGFDTELYDIMRGQWDEVIVYPAREAVGYAPQHGRLHLLDEWWDEALGLFLENLFRKRFFNLFVVHNVWLSKAFDYAPRRTIKLLDTHDLFWPRRALLDELGIDHDFFVPPRNDELFGISRADIAIMIQEQEARMLIGAVTTQIVTLPFYDNDLAQNTNFTPRDAYLNPDKVSFGFLGSAHTFNVRGMQSVLDALETEIGQTFAPVEMLIAGEVSELLRTDIAVEHLGYVPDEMTLYERVDFAIAPNFSGTGFKVKVADCVAIGVPLVVAAHAALGTSLDTSLVVETPREMAKLMSDIALSRPNLAFINAAMRRAKTDIQRRTSHAETNLFSVLQKLRATIVIDLRSFEITAGILPLMSYFSQLRSFAQMQPVIVILSDSLFLKVHKLLPVGVRAIAGSATGPELLREFDKWVLDAAGTGPAALGVTPHNRYGLDTRWAGAFERRAACSELAYFHPNITWEPAIGVLRKLWRNSLPAKSLPDLLPKLIVFVDHLPKTKPSQVIELKTISWIINIHRPDDFEHALMMMLEAPHGEIVAVWGAATQYGMMRILMGVCAVRNFSFTCALQTGQLFKSVLGEPSMSVEKSIASVLEALAPARTAS